MVPLLVLFRTGIRVRKLDLFFANFKELLKTRIFLANSKMLKTLWFRVCIREETEPMKSDMVPFLVPFRKGIMVPKIDQQKWPNRWSTVVEHTCVIGSLVWFFIRSYHIPTFEEKTIHDENHYRTQKMKILFSQMIVFIPRRGIHTFLLLLLRTTPHLPLRIRGKMVPSDLSILYLHRRNFEWIPRRECG